MIRRGGLGWEREAIWEVGRSFTLMILVLHCILDWFLHFDNPFLIHLNAG